MKCALDGGNTKVFAKAVQSLSKFGGELFLEAENDAIQLRTLNSAKSAVATYRFSSTFFDYYEVSQHEVCCKLDMKACLAVFRSTKQVERCDMIFQQDKAKFQIQLKCQHETLKNTCISVDDEENIIAEMTPENTYNSIKGLHKIFTEISNNFNPTEEEITLEANDKNVSIKNYVEGSRVNEKFMRSQLQLNADEFEHYKVEKKTSVTFCLKEFRALLMFAEAINENLCLHFDEAGSPVFVSIKHGDQIYCLLIMSTLSQDDVSLYNSCHATEVRECTKSSIKHKRKLRSSDTDLHKILRNDLKQRCIADETTLSNTSSLFHFGSSGGTHCSMPSTVDRIEKQPTMRESDKIHLQPAISADSDDLQTIQQNNNVFSTTESHSDEEDCILESPNHHEKANLRTIFSRCFHATYVPNEPLKDSSEIYASASDFED